LDEQAQPLGQGQVIASMDIATWIATAWNWGVGHWVWILIFFLCGGGAVLAAPFRWVYDQLPYRRRELAAQEEQLARELAAREEQLAIEAAQRKQEKAEAEARHRETCRCGSDCDGYKKCEKHHADCNCTHRSICVCEVEEDCDCECRCDCRKCAGFRKPGPLGRVPAGTGATEGPAATPAPGSTAAAGAPGKVAPLSWKKAHAQWLELCERYAAYECDPHELVRLPALADVTFGPTATFIEAFYEAQQLLTDQKPEDDRRAKRFVAAVAAANSAWTVAREAAERVRTSRYTEDEQVLLRRALSALELAQNASGPEERAQGYAGAARLMQELAKRTEPSGRWRMPDKSREQIEAWARRELDSTPSTP
jgi:hypothetical protein